MYTPEELAVLDRRVEEDLEKTRTRRLVPVDLQDLRLRYESQQKILEGLRATGSDVERSVSERLLPRIAEIFVELDRQQRERENEEILEEISAMNMAAFKRFVVHDEAFIRKATVEKAVEMTFEAVLDVIVDAMAYEQDPGVLASMVLAVETMGTRMQCGEVLRFLAHEDPTLRMAALSCVRKLDRRRLDSHVLPGLKDEDPAVRAFTCRLLSSTHATDVDACVEAMAAHDRPEHRQAAVGVLDLLEDRRRLELLSGLVADADPDVSRCAIEALGDDADEAALQAFLDLVLRDPASERGSLILDTVGRIHGGLSGRSAELAQAILMARANAMREEREREEFAASCDGSDEDDLVDEEPHTTSMSKLRAPRSDGADDKKDVVAKKFIRLAGKVLDGRTRAAVRGANVRIAQTGYQMQTDRRGVFLFDRIERCKVYVFIVEAQGYPNKTHRFRTSGQQDQSITIRLHRGGGGG